MSTTITPFRSVWYSQTYDDHLLCGRDATIGSSQTSNDAITEGIQTDHVETASTACQIPEPGSFDTAHR